MSFLEGNDKILKKDCEKKEGYTGHLVRWFCF